ncbi:putative Insulinoma-associated protein 1 [Hypsibius exemplaris]|uniref:Insulinoma-associated protein 1 n=1 Tax=Hypsibius exemplaris TaxID=2072580 RepID=A0A9X6ND99_HYPEX|nr:putative Insulinoma-associated protein 1 [Hypsibius exemplaris]
MPRNVLRKRRSVNDPGATIATLDQSGHQAYQPVTVGASSHLAAITTTATSGVRRPPDSDEEELPSPPASEDSCDSGRDSTVPGEDLSGFLSHSVSFDSARPSQLSLGVSINGSSPSSSSDSLLLSPFFHSTSSAGHISLLPGILESLAVSGNQQGLNHHATSSSSPQVRQLLLAQPPCYVETAAGPTPVTGESPCPLSRQMYGVELGGGISSPAAEAGSVSFPSPTSRKRTNSITNAGENGVAGTIASIRPVPKQRKTKSRSSIQPQQNELSTSPVSGTTISSGATSRTTTTENDVIVIRRGDLDKSLNVVEVTEAARAGLAEIVNRIGPYACKLCKLTYPDAFGLAGHNCSRIIHIEYQCPECGKSFHCPANLASHRRWHKPRPVPAGTANTAPPVGPVKAELCAKPTTKAEVKPERSFVEKIENASIPFKKRFLFRESVEKEAAMLKPEPRDSLVMRQPANGAPPTILLQEFQQHRCQICGAVVRGTSLFARHWQGCLVSAANRSWSAMFCQQTSAPPKSS